MPSPRSLALLQLRHLDSASPDFHGQLYNVLYGEEYNQYVPILQGDDLVWLAEYLDKVRRCISPPHSLLKPVQALDCLDPSGPAFRKCLRELRSRCGAGGILPTSYMLPPHRINVGSEPFASGGHCDVYEGTLDGSRICIKRIRVYTHLGPQKTARVRCRRRRFPRSPSLTEPTDLLSRGHNVETFEAPKHPIPTRCHYDSLPIHFELDAWRRPVGIHREEPQCGSTQTGRCPSYRDYPLLTPLSAI